MSIQFREVAGRPELTGRTLAEYAERGLGSGTEAAVAALIELQVDGGFIGIFHGMDEGDVRRLMNHPLTMFETDGDLVSPGVGFPHPRNYGSFPRILGRYVRDEGVLDLPTAIHKMTGQPAAWYGQSDRGRLTAAFLADITVFDAGLVADRVSDEDLVSTLRAHRFNLRAAAEALGLSPGNLYRRMDECPGVRKASELGREEIEEALTRLSGDLEAAAAALEVSLQGFKRRMTTLGMTRP